MGNNTYYNNQLITYIGNKRKLIKHIEKIVKEIISNDLNGKDREDIKIADLFSGSGVVSRMLKTYAGKLIVNDIEEYSKVISECYLSNKDSFSDEKYEKYLEEIQKYPVVNNGIIRKLYSPKDDNNISETDRCFYTNENATLIDTYRQAIDKIVPNNYKKYFLAPLIYEASVHVNTGGIFKGFYKDKNTKIGKFGGTNNDSLSRIIKKISLEKPILSDYDSDVKVYCEDANELVKRLKKIDITYIDSPYNQHPYSSNYFMLSLINKYTEPSEISKVSGIPKGWTKSLYNKKDTAIMAMHDLITNLDSKWIILSYSSDGIITFSDMLALLDKHSLDGINIYEIDYQILKSSRNRKDVKRKLTEYIFVIRKG